VLGAVSVCSWNPTSKSCAQSTSRHEGLVVLGVKYRSTKTAIYVTQLATNTRSAAVSISFTTSSGRETIGT
jgi:hypothetical protein